MARETRAQVQARLDASARSDAAMRELAVLVGSAQNNDLSTYALPVEGAATPGDAVANPANAALLEALEMLWNGGTWERRRVPSVFKSFASTAITAGTGMTAWTPAAGKKFRLMGLAISTSAAGLLILGDNAVGTVIFRTPALAAAGFIVLGGDDLGNGILSALANNVLKLDGPTGNVAGAVWGTEE